MASGIDLATVGLRLEVSQFQAAAKEAEGALKEVGATAEATQEEITAATTKGTQQRSAVDEREAARRIAVEKRMAAAAAAAAAERTAAAEAAAIQQALLQAKMAREAFAADKAAAQAALGVKGAMESIAISAESANVAIRQAAASLATLNSVAAASAVNKINSQLIVLDEKSVLAGSGLGQLKRSMGTAAASALGISSIFTKLGSVVGTMAIGSAGMVAIFAGIAMLGKLIEKLGEKARKAKEDIQKIRGELDKLIAQDREERGLNRWERDKRAAEDLAAATKKLAEEQRAVANGERVRIGVHGELIQSTGDLAKYQREYALALERYQAASRDTAKSLYETGQAAIAAITPLESETNAVKDATEAVDTFALANYRLIEARKKLAQTSPGIISGGGTVRFAGAGRYSVASEAAAAAANAARPTAGMDTRGILGSFLGGLTGGSSLLTNLVAGGNVLTTVAGTVGGAVKGLVSHILHMGDAAQEAARQMRALRTSLVDSLAAWNAEIAGDDQALAIAAAQKRFDELYAAAKKLGDEALKQEALDTYAAALAKIREEAAKAAEEAQRAAETEEKARVKQEVATKEDWRIRLAYATATDEQGRALAVTYEREIQKKRDLEGATDDETRALVEQYYAALDAADANAKVTAEYEAQAAAAKQVAEATQDWTIRLLKAQGIDTTRMEREIELQRALEGVTDQALRALIEETFATEDLAAAAREAAEAAAAAAAAFEEWRQGVMEGQDFNAETAIRRARLEGKDRTAFDLEWMQKFNREMKEADELYRAGKISWEDYLERQRLLQDEYAKATEEFIEALEKAGQDFADDMAIRQAKLSGNPEEYYRVSKTIEQNKQIDDAKKLLASGAITQKQFDDFIKLLADEFAAGLRDILAGESAKTSAAIKEQAVTDEVIKSVRGVSETTAVRMVDLQMSSNIWLQEIAVNTRGLRGTDGAAYPNLVGGRAVGNMPVSVTFAAPVTTVNPLQLAQLISKEVTKQISIALGEDNEATARNSGDATV